LKNHHWSRWQRALSMGTRPVKQDFATKKAWEEEKVEFSKNQKTTPSGPRTPVSQLSAAFSSRCTTIVMLPKAIRATISTSTFIVVEAARLPT
jgi:hypothetical protein